MTDIKTDAAYQLGAWMGRKQAFASLAGRCSAADAECLRQIRHGKHYRALKLNWEQFCKQEVGVSYITVDKIIRRLEEFGPAYFILTQATGITENEYRRISSAVHDQKLLHAGEEIPIDADHAPKLNAAIEQLRRESAAALPAEANAKGLPAEAHAEGGSGDTKAETDADPDVAKTVVEKPRTEVAREMQRAWRDAHAVLERYRQLAARRLEAHTRTALVDALHSLAGRAQHLCEDARPH